MKVLMLSRHYMKTHYRAGQETYFKSKFLRDIKIHTIRMNEKKHFKDGEEVSLRQWTGKPYASKQTEIGTATLGIEHLRMEAENGDITLCMIAGEKQGIKIHWYELAAHDGLYCGDFFDWFFPKGSGSIEADILHFTDFRYMAKAGGE